MPVVSPKTAADRFLHALTGCVPDLCGNLTLEPSQYIPNWRLADLDDDNEPEGFSLGRPEDPDGFYVYMSGVNAGPSTLAAQNTTPISLEEDTYYLKENYVPGHSPRDARFAVRASGPDPPTLETRPSSTDGFAAGTYKVAYTWLNGEKHTALSPSIEVTVGLGQYIRVFLPADIPDGADYVGLWLSSPNGGHDTLRFQHLIWAPWDMPESFVMRGPYRTKRVSTTRNETYITTPKAPTIVRVKREGGITKAGSYKARITRVDPRTHKESGPSDYSNEITLTQEEADKGIGIGLDAPVIGSYYVYFTIDGIEYRLNTDSSGGASGTRRPHNSARRGNTGRRRRWGGANCVDNLHVTTGHTTAERISSPLPKRDDLTLASPPGAESTSRKVIVGGLSGENDTAAYDAAVTVEDPTSPLDSVLAEGAVRITPGSYWVALSYSVRGEETLASPARQISIGSGQVGLVHLPDSNNLLANAQWSDTDANGFPDGWSLSGVATSTQAPSTGGYVYYDDDRSIVLDTLGSKTGTTPSPTIWQYITINRNQFYAVGGIASTVLTSGSGEVQLREFSSDGALLRVSTILSLSSTGSYVSFNTVFGAGYTEFHGDTEYIALQAMFAGSTRNGLLYLHELYVNPNSSRRLRRTASPLPQSREFTNASPPTHTRWNKESIVGVMLPPGVRSYSTKAAPLAIQDFESTDMLGWSLFQNSTSGTLAGRATNYAISGSYGYRTSKTTTSFRQVWLQRDMGSPSADLALSFMCRVVTRNDRGNLYVAMIRTSTSQASSLPNLAALLVDYKGGLWVEGVEFDGRPYQYKVGSGIVSGDVLNVELRVLGAGTSNGIIEVLLGKNGASRTVIATLPHWRWTQGLAQVCYVGLVGLSDPAARVTVDVDDIIVTRSGSSTSLASGPPEGFAYEGPDGPYESPTVLEDASFDGGTLTPFTSSRTPTDSTTAVAVETGAKIDGTHGVRCADTGTSTVASAYIQRTLSPTRTTVGLRARYRVVIRPGTGTIDLMTILSSGGQTLGRFRLDNLGDLYAQTLTAAGAQHAITRVARNVTNGTILTLEMVPTGVGSESGALSYWVSVGGTGAVAERRLMAQHIVVPWSALNITTLRTGIVAESVAGATSTLNVDSVRVTEAGEVLYSTLDSDGNEIYQAYFYYPAGTPQRDDLGLKDMELAVQPNETYTFAIFCRHADVPIDTPAYPYSLYAYDTSGTEYPLGSVYGSGGATGTSGWQDRSLTFTVPTDCYVLGLSSPGISSGEFVAQAPVLSRGTEVSREITYADSGEVWAILDTHTPESFAFSPEGADPLSSRWLDLGSVIDTPAGTSYAAQYNSADPVVDTNGEPVFTGTEMPTSWLSDPLAVKPRRYAHFLLQLTPSSDLKRTPTLRTHTPYVDLYQNLGGQQVSVLLRDDLSEFSGGVHILSDIGFFTEESEFDVRQPLGKVRRNRMWEPVGEIGPFTMRAYTRDAVRDIQENALSLDFCVETRDYRLIVRFRDRVTFGGFSNTRKVQGVWCTLAEASVDGAEVIEAIPINDLVDSLVAP